MKFTALSLDVTMKLIFKSLKLQNSQFECFNRVHFSKGKFQTNSHKSPMQSNRNKKAKRKKKNTKINFEQEIVITM